MRVECHDRFGHPVAAEATRVLVFDDDDNPVSLTVKIADGHVFTAHLGDPEFPHFLHQLGLEATRIIAVDPKKLKA